MVCVLSVKRNGGAEQEFVVEVRKVLRDEIRKI